MHCNFKGVNINDSYMTKSFDKKMNIQIEFMINGNKGRNSLVKEYNVETSANILVIFKVIVYIL